MVYVETGFSLTVTRIPISSEEIAFDKVTARSGSFFNNFNADVRTLKKNELLTD